MGVLLRLGWRFVVRRLLQSGLFVFGVGLGVGLVVAIDIANASASRAFALSSESLAGSASHQIVGGPNGFSSGLYRWLRVEMGVRRSAPALVERALARGDDQLLRLMGVDVFAEGTFRSYLRGEGEGFDFAALGRLVAEPGAVVISETLAGRLGLRIGDDVELSVAGRFRRGTVAGILRPEDSGSRQALDDLILSDIATAQEWTGHAGRLSHIDLILDEAEEERLRGALPAGVSLVEAGQGGALSQMTAAFEIHLTAMSLLALVVGLFLIYNTVSFSVAQRRGLIGILRSLGAARAQIFGFILGEALMLGAVGALLGLGLGALFGRGAVALVSRTISDLYFAVNAREVSVAAETLWKGGAVGLIASMLGAFLPALEASRTAPAGLLERSREEEGARRLLPFITGAGLLVILIGVFLLLWPGGGLSAGFAALLAILLGGALFTPLGLLAFMRLLLPVCGALFGLLGRMACRSVTRSLSRTSVAVAALTIAVSVIVGVNAMISSFRVAVSGWLEASLGAQIFVAPPQFANNSASVDVSSEVLTIARGVDGVSRVSAARAVTVIAPEYPRMPPVNLLASDFDIAGERRRFRWRRDDGAHQAALDAGMVMVSESFAYRRGIDAGNGRIRLATDKGERDFEVYGVYADYSTDQGAVYMARSVYDAYYEDPFITTLGIFVQDGAEAEEVMARLRAALSDYDMVVQDNAGLRRGALEVFDRTFAITAALRLLTTLVAFIGILSALMSLQLERRREYGAMRAIGMTRGQLTAFTLAQTGLMGLVAGVLALPIGTALSLALIEVINLRSFGWTMDFVFVPGEFAEAVLIAVLAALLAGLYPSWRMGRTRVAEALRSE